jgi:hypothetical protein
MKAGDCNLPTMGSLRPLNFSWLAKLFAGQPMTLSSGQWRVYK